jgi:hypothetical protein
LVLCGPGKKSIVGLGNDQNIQATIEYDAAARTISIWHDKPSSAFPALVIDQATGILTVSVLNSYGTVQSARDAGIKVGQVFQLNNDGLIHVMPSA